MAADATQEGPFISKACFNNQLQFKAVSDTLVIKKEKRLRRHKIKRMVTSGRLLRMHQLLIIHEKVNSRCYTG